MWDAMEEEADSKVGVLLRTFVKTPEDWYDWIGRGIIKLQDGDEIKEINTCIDRRFFHVYGFELPEVKEEE